MPSKGCDLGIDFLDTVNDFNLDKNIKSLSLDPIMKRLIHEKNSIMRDIEGWVASQANDGARQPILAVTIATWIKKAIGYMRCGMQLIRQITKLITDTIAAITKIINSITAMIASDLAAIQALQNQMKNILNEIKEECKLLAITEVINLLQDGIALYNEIGATRAELLRIKSTLSFQHLGGQIESAFDQLLMTLHSFECHMNAIQRHNYLKTSLEAARSNLEASLIAAQNINLTIPMNPGGINPGALSNFTITNHPELFQDYDALTHNTMLVDWDSRLTHVGLTSGDASSLIQWVDIFKSDEEGYVAFSANDYGVFEIGLGYDTQFKCAGGYITVRLIINGGDWIIEANIFGMATEHDNPNQNAYATKQGVFIKVPNAPDPHTRFHVTFDEFIQSANRPTYIDNYIGTCMVAGVPATYLDPYSGDVILIPEKNVDYILQEDTIVDLTPVPDIYHPLNPLRIDPGLWMASGRFIMRYPTQHEINLMENSYTNILNNLGLSPILFVNPYSQLGNSLYNQANDPSASVWTDAGTPGVFHYEPRHPGDTPYDPTDPHSQIVDLEVSLPSEYSLWHTEKDYIPIDRSMDLTSRHFRMSGDSQIRDVLWNKKPYIGMQIFTNSLSFQIMRNAAAIINVPRFHYTETPDQDSHVVSFGLKADWGFAPTAQLS
jgi:hypothetical protein